MVPARQGREIEDATPGEGNLDPRLPRGERRHPHAFADAEARGYESLQQPLVSLGLSSLALGLFVFSPIVLDSDTVIVD